MSDRDIFIQKIRASIAQGHQKSIPEKPANFPSRAAGMPEEELSRLFREIFLLTGDPRSIERKDLYEVLTELVEMHAVQRATAWRTRWLQELGIEEILSTIGVEIISSDSPPKTLATCELGITEVDFALPETGTLVLRSSPEKPRLVSLLPRVHLAVLNPQVLRADLSQVFSECRDDPYLIMITGPSRTSDIELTVTLGVHGPKNLIVLSVQ